MKRSIAFSRILAVPYADIAPNDSEAARFSLSLFPVGFRDKK